MVRASGLEIEGKPCRDFLFGGIVAHDDRLQALEVLRRHVSMPELSKWMAEDKPRESITPLQMHVFLGKTRKYARSLQLDQDDASTGFFPLQLGIFYAL